MKFLAEVLAAIGTSAAKFGTQGCAFLFFYESKIPFCLIDK